MADPLKNLPWRYDSYEKAVFDSEGNLIADVEWNTIGEAIAAEHNAWEALRSGTIDEIVVEAWKGRKPFEWAVSSEDLGARAADPVDAVLAAIKEVRGEAKL